MSSNLVIPPIKIDLSVKQRKKGFNKRHQLQNPAGDFFNIPEKCKQHNHKRFKCAFIDYEDVKNFRNQLYASTEKREQRDFLSNFIATPPPKRRTGRAEVARVMQVYYKITKIDNEEVPVCREMFFAVTGLGRSRVKTIVDKLYKKELLENGDSEKLMKSSTTHNPRKSKTKIERECQLKTMLAERKEKMLRLERGTYENFSNAINLKRNSDGEIDKSQEFIVLKLNDEIGVEEEYQDCILEEFEQVEEIEEEPEDLVEGTEDLPEESEDLIKETEDVIVQKVQLNLESYEICRICLQKNHRLVPLFEKLENEQNSYSEMMEFGMSLELLDQENLPRKICVSCLERVKIACELRNDVNYSQDIIEQCLEEKESNIIPVDKTSEEFLSQNYLVEEEQFELDDTGNLEYEYIVEDVNVVDSSVNSGDLKPVKCYLCEQNGIDCNFDTENPEEHFQDNHSEIQLTKCNSCDFETEFMWYLNLHLHLHVQIPKHCEFCGRIFENQKKYTIHLRWCGKQAVKNFKCLECPCSYTRLFDLKVHERIHTQEKPYSCTDCPAKFAKRIMFRRHLLKKHNKGVKAICKTCGKGYIQQYELTRHQKYCNKKEF